MTTDLFRVVRTLNAAEGHQVLASDPIDRETAMARFDEMVAWGMDRVRVIREQDYRPAVAAEPVRIRQGITGCRRWVPNGGACALSGGHDGPCVPVEAQR